ncbi:MAG TPA: hypothetical protein VF677_01435 [Flavobacterium sp.]|jgi:hypothetical protein
MTTSLRILLFVLGLFTFSNATAQFGSPYSGVDRSVGRGQYANGAKKTEKVDYIALTVDKLEKDLTLDAFQKAIVKEALVKSTNEETNIMAMDIPDGSKLEKRIALRDKLDVEINKILTPEQVEKFRKLREKTKSK